MNNKFTILESGKVMNLETGNKFALNETGKIFINELLKSGFDDAVINLSQKFSIDNSIIKDDLNELYERLSVEREYAIGDLPYKNYVVLEPTNDCSANCVHCFHQNKKKYSWGKNEIDSHINTLLDAGITSVSLTGGEIFSPHYINLAKYLITQLEDKGIRICTISTNGMFITDELVEWIKKNIDYSEIVFRISLDSVEETIYRLRPGYSEYFNLNYWKLLNDNNFHVVVTTIVSLQKETEIVKIADFLIKQKCVKKWIVKPLVPTKTGHFKLIDWEQIKNNYIAFLEWYKEHMDAVNYDFILGNVITKKALTDRMYELEYDLEEHPCKNEMFQKTIKANGSITRCPMLPDISDCFQTSIDNISNCNQELFDDLVVNDMDCKDCDYQVICGGGCRAYAIAFSGDVRKCDVNSKIMFDWIVNDNYFKDNWKLFYINLVKKNGIHYK